MTYHADYSYNQPIWDSEYDSTWEGDEEDEEPKSKKMKTSHQHNRWSRAARDMQNYRHGYPDDSHKPNLLFYQNKIPFMPRGVYIDDMHKSWRNDYYTLETNHNFIQWLFPLREPGVNPQATPLSLSEIQMMKKDKQVMKRLLESYELMLDFYGLVLMDKDTGEVARAEDKWEDRFYNLNNHTHNNLRITRILKCLGEMGYEKFQAPLVKFFLEETLCNGELPNVKTSALDYFMFTVKDKKERQRLVHFAWVNYIPQDSFRWGPVEKLTNFSPMPKKTEQICEKIIEEPPVDTIIPKSDSSLGVVVDIEVANEEAESRREGFCSLVRKALGYIVRPFRALFRLLSRPFVAFFRLLYRPFRCFFTGCFFWFRGERTGRMTEDNEEENVRTEGTKTENSLLLHSPEQPGSHKADTSEKGAKLEKEDNEEENVRTEGTKTEHSLLLHSPEQPGSHKATTSEKGAKLEKEDNEEERGRTEGTKTENSLLLHSPEQPGSHKAEVKALDEQSDNSANLEAEDNGSDYESIPEDDTEQEHGKPLVTNRLPIRRQRSEDDNGAEDEDNAGNFTKYNQRENVIKLDKDPASLNKSFKDSEEEYYYDSDERTEERAKHNSGGDRTYFGPMIANAGETEVEGASDVERGPLLGGDGGVTESA